MSLKIKAFWIYHDDFYYYTKRVQKYIKQAEYVKEEMMKFDKEVQMMAEDGQWKLTIFCWRLLISAHVRTI
jgi:hypothetical protein